MGFKKRTCTTPRPEVPEHVEHHSIPLPLVMNFNQTPLKYAPVANQTLSRKGSKHVAIKGQFFKQAVTFGITFSDKFLPMQLIYGGKTKRSLPKVKFPDSFSLTVNKKHFSNTNELLKLIEDIITPYVEKERGKLGLSDNQPALVIFEVFSGQMTDPVMQKKISSRW